MGLTERGEEHAPLGHKLLGERSKPQPKEVIDLSGEDRHSDTSREAQDNRIGNELDQRA